jgi:hypothetical protein
MRENGQSSDAVIWRGHLTSTNSQSELRDLLHDLPLSPHDLPFSSPPGIRPSSMRR